MQNLNCPLQYKQILNPFKHESVQQRSCKQQMNPAEKFTAELLDPFLSSHVLLFLFLTALEHISFSFPSFTHKFSPHAWQKLAGQRGNRKQVIILIIMTIRLHNLQLSPLLPLTSNKLSASHSDEMNDIFFKQFDRNANIC